MRKSKIIILAGLVCFALAGCGKDAKTEEPDKTDKVSDIKEPDEKPENTEKIEDTEKPGNTVSFEEAFEKGLVDKNGSYFVEIGRKIYFRNISPDSMQDGAIFGSFLSGENKAVECPLICYDLDTCEWEEVGKITGVGKLYACPDGFYIQENADEPSEYLIDLYDLKTGRLKAYCKGTPRGVSDSGKLLAVEQYGAQNAGTVLIKDGREIVRLDGENVFYEYFGFAGEELIVFRHESNEDGYTLCSVNENGDITELGSMKREDYGYPELEQFQVLDGEVYLSIGFYDGTGHFLAAWRVVKAKPGVKGSLETVTDGSDQPDDDIEGPENSVPKFYFDETRTLCFAKHLPYQAYMGDDSYNRNDLLYYNDIFEECPLIRNFITNDYSENCQVIQDISSSYDTIFVIYADAQYDSEYDVGWRLGYRMTGWHICAIPFGNEHLDKNGQAKDIIIFYSSGTDVSDNVTDSERQVIEKKLNSIVYYGFLQSLYEDPRDIEWSNVFYVGAGFDQGNPPEEVKKAYLAATGEEEIMTDLTTISGKDVRDHVKKTTGYELSEMKHPLDNWVYLKDQDLYLFEHGDTNQLQVDVTAVHYEDGKYTVAYDHPDGKRYVTFTDEGNAYRFLSNVAGPKSEDEASGDADPDMITDGMIIPDSDQRRLTEEDLEGLSDEELRIARNEIYARHGRKFKDEKLQVHFDQMEWYTAMYDASEFDERSLNIYELYNLDFISRYEKSNK